METDEIKSVKIDQRETDQRLDQTSEDRWKGKLLKSNFKNEHFKVVHARNLEITLLIEDFSKEFDSICRQ